MSTQVPRTKRCWIDRPSHGHAYVDSNRWVEKSAGNRGQASVNGEVVMDGSMMDRGSTVVLVSYKVAR